jgi:hypothetical protein
MQNYTVDMSDTLSAAERPPASRGAEKWLHAGLLSMESYEQGHDSDSLASCIALDPACGGATVRG